MISLIVCQISRSPDLLMSRRWKSSGSVCTPPNNSLVSATHIQSSRWWLRRANYNNYALWFLNGQVLGNSSLINTPWICIPCPSVSLLLAKENVALTVPLDGRPTSSRWRCRSFSSAGMTQGGLRWKVRTGSRFLRRVKEPLWNQIFLGPGLTLHNLMQHALL